MLPSGRCERRREDGERLLVDSFRLLTGHPDRGVTLTDGSP